MDNEERAPRVSYKIESGKTAMIYRQEVNGRMFYKALITKKNLDGSYSKAYKPVKFKKDAPEVLDGTLIKVISGFEDWYIKASDKYNPVWLVFILEFEICERPEDRERLAVDDYTNQINEYDSIITDEDLPF